MARYKLVLIAGMHRSGTSALTRVVNLLGAHLPDNLLPAKKNENPKGFWEPTDFVALNEALLAEHGLNWDDPRPLRIETEATQAAVDKAFTWLSQHLPEAGALALKDPRLCRLLPIWLLLAARCDADVKVLLPFRHPVEVCSSVSLRNDISAQQSLLLWIEHVLESEHSSRECLRLFMSFSSLLERPQQACQRLVEFLGLPPPSAQTEAAIRDFLETELRHHTAATASGTELESASARLSAKIFQGLLTLENESSNAQMLLEFDLHRRSIHDFLNPIDERWRAVNKAINEELDSCQRDLAGTKQELEASQSLNQNLERELLRAQDHVGRLERDHHELQFNAARNHQKLAALEQRGLHLARSATQARAAGTRAMAASARPLHQPNEMSLRQHHRPSSLFETLQSLSQPVRERRRRIKRLNGQFDKVLIELFDPAWYSIAYGTQLNDAWEVLQHWADSGCLGDIHPGFDGQWYQARNPDLAHYPKPAIAHYIEFGANEERAPSPLFDSSWYRDRYQLQEDENPLLHYRREGEAAGYRPNSLFDPRWYQEQHGAYLAGLSPLAHFRWIGGQLGLAASQEFDSAMYLDQYPDVAASGSNPLVHYIEFGKSEGREYREVE